MLCNPLSRPLVEAELLFRHQTKSPQQAQRIIDQVLLTDGTEMLALQILETCGGINQISPGLKGQRDRIDSIVTPLQVISECRSLAACQIHRPVSKHQSGHIPFFIENDAGAVQSPGQATCEPEGIVGDHEIEVRGCREAVQQSIPHRTAHQGGARRKQVQRQWPAFRLEARPEQHSSGIGLQNGVASSVRGHVHLCGLPLGRPLPGLSRGRETARGGPSLRSAGL